MAARLIAAFAAPALLALGCAGLSGAAAPACRAIDGDTLRCGSERVRLRSVHAPELHEPGGAAARARLAALIASGEVRLVRRGRDRYGRTLADVYVGERRITQRDVAR